MITSSQTSPTSREPSIQSEKLHDAERARQAITINKPRAEVFRFFRDFKHLPLFMKDLSHIDKKSETLSRWTVQLKNGLKVQWDAEIIAERVNEMISWRSVGHESEVHQAGSVWFLEAPYGRGTIVRLAMNYKVPGGRLTELAAKLTGEDSENLIHTNLRRLKSFLETGEIPTVTGQPSGRDEDLTSELRH